MKEFTSDQLRYLVDIQADSTRDRVIHSLHKVALIKTISEWMARQQLPREGEHPVTIAKSEPYYHADQMIGAVK